MSNERTYTVQVHKANVPLMGGESIHKFCYALKSAGCEYIKKKYNIGKEGGAWGIEVFADKAVFNVAPQMSDIKKDFMVAVAYERDTSTGVFKFGDTMKVEAVTTYQAKDEMPITKAMGMDNWVALEDEQPSEPVKKSLWSGVV